MKKRFLACTLAVTLFAAIGAVSTSIRNSEPQDLKVLSSYSSSSNWTGVINANSVCLRSGPTTSSTIYCYLNKNQKVTVTYGPMSTGKYSWYQVIYKSSSGNITGYVCSDYID